MVTELGLGRHEGFRAHQHMVRPDTYVFARIMLCQTYTSHLSPRWLQCWSVHVEDVYDLDGYTVGQSTQHTCLHVHKMQKWSGDKLNRRVPMSLRVFRVLLYLVISRSNISIWPLVWKGSLDILSL